MNTIIKRYNYFSDKSKLIRFVAGMTYYINGYWKYWYNHNEYVGHCSKDIGFRFVIKNNKT